MEAEDGDLYERKIFGDEMTTYLDSILIDDLFIILLKSEGTVTVQIHYNEDNYRHLTSVRSMNGKIAEAVSIAHVID